jgi:cytochrome c oxidase subunit 2
MKTFTKLIAIAAAFGLAPVAAQAATAAPTANAATATAPTADNAAAPETNEVAAAPAVAETAPGGLPGVTSVPSGPRAAPTPGIGQPDGRYGLQDQFTPIGQEGAWFHDVILMWTITIISLFVLGLLGWVMFRYRRGANPTPSRNSHNTTLEVVWTLVPVLILVAIAIPSIRLLAHQYSPPQADVTIKAIGHQWYWSYEYPDLGVTFDSRLLRDDVAIASGEPRQLAVNNRMVVPVGATVKMIITSDDVLHAWGVPAFWVKIDAVPGRLNETWFRAEREGVFYGVCYELCGQQHGYMPIAVEVVSQERFRAWVAENGGSFTAAQPAAAAAAPTVAATEGTESTPAPSNVVAGNETAPATNQAATANQ